MASIRPQLPEALYSQDPDKLETQEWLDAISAVLENSGTERAHYLISELIELTRQKGADLPYSANTSYINTIPAELGARMPGDGEIEQRIRSYVRWNALAMVLRANRDNSGLGGHIASFASAATLFDVGFNWFWRAPTDQHGGDLVYFQGHSAPGVYARAFMLGRLSESQMDNFRREVDGKGLSSYPHPWLMPDFWQFPTVSMGLGPIQAIYQARFMKYMEDRAHIPAQDRKVWAFMGDGEMDEPESMGAIGLAAREQLDNLIFVVNCNLQRLDGPVRGNGKIIQELEAEFRGAGWNVIKVIWGGHWDPLLAADHTGILRKRMEECVDGDYQTFKSKDGAYVREYFFGKYPELKAKIHDWSNDDVWNLNRGGHDPHKVYAAFHAAVNHKGQPTVILAKTIKGYGMGEAGEAQNITHQQKKMDNAALRAFRDRFQLPIADDKLDQLPYLNFPEDSREAKYMKDRRMALGGYLPSRRRAVKPQNAPKLEVFDALLKASDGGRSFSTTMALVRLMGLLIRDKSIGARIVPIVPDESRTFGMEGMFRQLGIWNHQGQNYTPEDADQLMFYKESRTGQILQEGINEAGAMSSWIAAATAYSVHGVQVIPFFIFYSMFGFQRIGDLAWAAGDSRSRGFLIGGTSGRTTLNGEGLQHEDGHSHLYAATIPNCLPYDPTFSYEVAVIVQEGLRRMIDEQEDVFYYLTVLNENYEHPAMPGDSKKAQEDVRQAILKGMYLLQPSAAKHKLQVHLLGCGSILREALEAVVLLEKDWQVAAHVWSCPSFTMLARDARDCARWNMLNPEAKTPRMSWLAQCLKDAPAGPVIAATDYVRTLPEQLAPYFDRPFTVLGTDGFGRSDTREKLRHHFEVDRYWITLATLKALCDEGHIKPSQVAAAMKKYGLSADKPNPLLA